MRQALWLRIISGMCITKWDSMKNPCPGLKTFALDPRRSVAYANLAEAYFKLNRKSDAKKCLAKYLELAPNSRYASEIAAKMKTD